MTRVPVVLGLGRRVGASTIAAALHATEHGGRARLVTPTVAPHPAAAARGNTDAPGARGGTAPVRAPDVLVCAGGGDGLRGAEAVPAASVLLIVLVDDQPPPTRERQRALEHRHGLVVVLPHVPQWAGRAGVPDEAATLFARPPGQLRAELRAYTQGLRLAVTELLRAGGRARLQPPAAPPLPRKGATNATPGIPAGRDHTAGPAKPAATPGHSRSAPVARGEAADRAAPATPPHATAAAPPVLDDDALEAEALAAPTSAATPGAPTPPPAPGAPIPPPAPPPARLQMRDRHRPVMGPARAPTTKAG